MEKKGILWVTGLLLIILIIVAGCAGGPDIKDLYTDSIASTMYTDKYGRPGVVCLDNGYPIIEYIWDGSWIDKLVGNFYFINQGNAGDVKFMVHVEERKEQTFNLKANTSYIFRIKINEFGSTGPYRSERWEKHLIHIKVKNIEHQITFEAPQGTQRDNDALKLYDFEMILEELYDPGKIDSLNCPDKAWLVNSIWQEKFRYGVNTQTYIKFQDDGLFGYNDKKPEEFKFDGTETWEIKNRKLVLSWNDGYLYAKYQLTNKNTDCLFGTHHRELNSDSGHNALYMLQKLK